MKLIKLTQGQYALVDDADYKELSKYKWYALNMEGSFYAVRHASIKNGGKPHLIPMTRQILGLEYGDKRQGDHQNHNTLDNRRSNLRICTHSQNRMNRKNQQNTSSQFRGVYWSKYAKKWHAQISINNTLKHLGYFKEEKNAALAYDKVAACEYKEFANLNF